jgi:hypothetical protein
VTFNSFEFASHSVSAYLQLSFLFFFPLVILFAWATIVHKAGFSPWWVALPTVSYLLFVTELLLLFFDLQTIAFGRATVQVPATASDFAVLSWLEVLTGLASIVCFFVFAFIRWPVQNDADRGRNARSAAPPFVPPHGAGSAATPLRPMPASPTAAASAPVATLATTTPVTTTPSSFGPSAGAASAGVADTAVAVAVATPPPAPPATFFCSWCGKERQRDAHAIHHCGSRERPPLFCSACGRGLEPRAETCARCGTSTSQLSPG